MLSFLVRPGKVFPWLRVGGVVVLAMLLSGWTACVAIVGFSSCPGPVPQPHVTALSPDGIPSNAESVLLIVNGSGFIPQSQIMWNGSPLPTTFTDSRHLQATITQQTIDSLGGSGDSSALISVRSQMSTSVGVCSSGSNSATLVQLIR